MEWSQRAACLSAEPEMFFPIGAGEGSARETEAAKAVCGRCQVIDDCRDYAIATRQPHGVWGGLDEDERRALLGTRTPAVVG